MGVLDENNPLLLPFALAVENGGWHQRAPFNLDGTPGPGREDWREHVFGILKQHQKHWFAVGVHCVFETERPPTTEELERQIEIMKDVTIHSENYGARERVIQLLENYIPGTEVPELHEAVEDLRKIAKPGSDMLEDVE